MARRKVMVDFLADVEALETKLAERQRVEEEENPLFDALSNRDIDDLFTFHPIEGIECNGDAERGEKIFTLLSLAESENWDPVRLRFAIGLETFELTEAPMNCDLAGWLNLRQRIEEGDDLQMADLAKQWRINQSARFKDIAERQWQKPGVKMRCTHKGTFGLVWANTTAGRLPVNTGDIVNVPNEAVARGSFEPVDKPTQSPLPRVMEPVRDLPEQPSDNGREPAKQDTVWVKYTGNKEATFNMKNHRGQTVPVNRGTVIEITKRTWENLEEFNYQKEWQVVKG